MHLALVAPHYHVGSFDDDASYVLTAKALLAGGGLTGHLASGEPLIGVYAPGYGALLAPLVWIWPHSFLPLRLLSAACFAAVFPLTWIWLGRRQVTDLVRVAVLTLLALGPPFATYGTMVMAETPFLVVLLLLLLVLDRWRDEARALSRSGLAVVGLAAALIWLKQAGIGLVVGLCLWLPLSRAPRRWAKAAVLAAGVAVTLVPVVVARLSAGVPLAGARYSQELGGYYQGGLLKRLVDVVPGSAWHLVSTAVPATLVPYLEPLPIQGGWGDVWQVVSWQVTILVGLGALLWVRRHRDASLIMALVYLAESVLWPFVNERRTILILPVLAAWYVTGAEAVWAEVRRRVPDGAVARVVRPAAMVLVALGVAVPLVAQMPRDYLYGWGQSGSDFGGSRYAAVLRHLGRPGDVVETDYRWATALFTGHVTNWTAFTSNLGAICYTPGVWGGLRADRAGFLLVGDFNKPGQIDNSCVASRVFFSSWAVPILHTNRDNATVYELIGPYSAHPDLVDLLRSGSPPAYAADARGATLTWSLPGAAQISQISVGEAAARDGATTDVRVEVQRPGGGWVTVTESPSAVGEGAGRAPYLLVAPDQPIQAVAVRLVLEGPRAADGVNVTNVAVLGPPPDAPAATTRS